jgi:hypothetical protein
MTLMSTLLHLNLIPIMIFVFLSKNDICFSGRKEMIELIGRNKEVVMFYGLHQGKDDLLTSTSLIQACNQQLTPVRSLSNSS